VIGACYEEYFAPNASVLICNSPNQSKEKMRFAYEWNVPAVIADWLWISVQTSEKKSFDPYLVSKKRTAKKNPSLCPKKEKPGMSDRDHDGEENLRDEGLDTRPENNHIHAHSSRGHDGNSPTTLSQSLSKSPSPSKEQILIPTLPIPRQDLNSKNSEVPGPSTSLDMAISELLKQKRAGSKVSSVERTDCRRQIKWRPLLGRANSQSSSRAATAAGGAVGQQKEISRASSIDTLNEDGYGSIVDGLDSPSKHANSNSPSFVSILTDSNTTKMRRSSSWKAG
jgi:DNA replication regulator DPB11